MSDTNESGENIANGSPKNVTGDPIQRAAREERLKKSLRENLKRRKTKSRLLSKTSGSDEKS